MSFINLTREGMGGLLMPCRIDPEMVMAFAAWQDLNGEIHGTHISLAGGSAYHVIEEFTYVEALLRGGNCVGTEADSADDHRSHAQPGPVETETGLGCFDRFHSGEGQGRRLEAAGQELSGGPG